MIAPGILRRLAAMVYEAVVLTGLLLVASAIFMTAAGGSPILGGWQRYALQAYEVSVLAAYFLWCWIRGGQTLPMKAWHLRLVMPGRPSVPPARALLRFATLPLMPVSVLWALFDPDGQFLHDRIVGTRLVSVPR